ncbi:hypothetical protein GBAR_LOCUS29677, partial [Geodia barretti]
SSSSSLNPLSPYQYIPVQVQALIFSLKVSNFAGGVHGHQAIVSFLPLVTTVDHGALPWSTLNNAICCLLSIGEPRACARQGRCPMRLRAYYQASWQTCRETLNLQYLL